MGVPRQFLWQSANACPFLNASIVSSAPSVCVPEFFVFNGLQERTRGWTLFFDAIKCSPDVAPPQTTSFSFFNSSVLKLALQCRQATAGYIRCWEAVSVITSHQNRDASCITLHIHRVGGWCREPQHNKDADFCHCAHFHHANHRRWEVRARSRLHVTFFILKALTCLWQLSFLSDVQQLALVPQDRWF